MTVNIIHSDDKIWKIYEISSTVSPRLYVGVTSQSLEKRLYYHIHCTSSNKKKMNWLSKYKDSLQIKLLIENLTENEAYLFEIEIIKSYRMMYGNKLILNLDNGGRGGRTGIKSSVQTRQKISQAHKGKKLSEHQRKAIAANRPGKKPVIAINLETGEKTKFDSQKEAARFLNLDESSVRKCLSSRFHYTKNYTFIRYDTNNTL